MKNNIKIYSFANSTSTAKTLWRAALIPAAFGATLFAAPTVADAACVGGTPDGEIEYSSGEECDDNNLVDGDGCDSACVIDDGYACTGPFDFSSGIKTEGDGGTGGNWNITNEYVATQTVNASRPTVGYNFGADSKTPGLTFRMGVPLSGDDDFMGLVIGWKEGNFTNPSADYLLIDWKRGNQCTGAAAGLAGLALSRVTGPYDNIQHGCGGGAFWNHSGPVAELARANTLGSTGWALATNLRF